LQEYDSKETEKCDFFLLFELSPALAGRSENYKILEFSGKALEQ
jgi:hypothetical protein